MTNEQKKKFLEKLLDDYKTDLLADNFNKVFYSLDSYDSDKRKTLIAILDELGIDFLASMDHIPARMFSGTDIKTLKIPEKVKVIGEGAFEDCEQLESIELPESLKGFLPANCFKGCIKLQNIFLPDGCEGLGSFCFRDCDELKTIVIRRYSPESQKGQPNYQKHPFSCKSVDQEFVKERLKWIDPGEDPKKYFK